MRLARQVVSRLLLALGAIFGAVQLFRWLLLPALQAVFQSGEVATSVLRRTGIFVFALLAYWAYVRFIEKREVRELCVAPRAIALGALSGAALIWLAMLCLFALGAYEMVAYRGLQNSLPGVACVILIAAMLEEIVFRGVVFRIFESAWGTLPALWLQSLIFAALHIANVEARAGTAELITTVVSGTLIGAFWTLVFVHSRNLWVVAANHAAWNFSIILVGVPLSGLDNWHSVALMDSGYRGPPWLTGGVFGPEDSIVSIALIALSLVLLLHRARTMNRLAPAARQTESSPRVA